MTVSKLLIVRNSFDAYEYARENRLRFQIQSLRMFDEHGGCLVVFRTDMQDHDILRMQGHEFAREGGIIFHSGALAPAIAEALNARTRP